MNARACVLWNGVKMETFSPQNNHTTKQNVNFLLTATVYRCRPRTMQQYYKGGVYWDELAEICGDISRVVGFQGAARFR